MYSLFYLSFLFLIPWIGTSLGSFGVFFLKKELNSKIEKFILGFSSGVMFAALVWSLLLPAIERDGYIASSFGFMLGILFLLVIDNFTPHLHFGSDQAEGVKSKLGKSSLLIIAIILHNIPEGLAVGSSAGAFAFYSDSISFSTVIALSLGIALQNIPEGLVVSLPLYQAGKSKFKAFLSGSLSGIVEPIASFIAYFIIGEMVSILSYLLAFAAGAMFYVVIEDLVPETAKGEHSNLGVFGSALGFVIMMILDGVFS